MLEFFQNPFQKIKLFIARNPHSTKAMAIVAAIVAAVSAVAVRYYTTANPSVLSTAELTDVINSNPDFIAAAQNLTSAAGSQIGSDTLNAINAAVVAATRASAQHTGKAEYWNGIFTGAVIVGSLATLLFAKLGVDKIVKDNQGHVNSNHLDSDILHAFKLDYSPGFREADVKKPEKSSTASVNPPLINLDPEPEITTEPDSNNNNTESTIDMSFVQLEESDSDKSSAPSSPKQNSFSFLNKVSGIFTELTTDYQKASQSPGGNAGEDTSCVPTEEEEYQNDNTCLTGEDYHDLLTFKPKT